MYIFRISIIPHTAYIQHKHTQTDPHEYTNRRMQTYMKTHTETHTTHECVNTHAHTHTHEHAHIHTHNHIIAFGSAQF